MRHTDASGPLAKPAIRHASVQDALRGSTFLGRHRVGDSGFMTFDNARRAEQGGNAYGRKLEHPVNMRDGRMADSTGAFMVGELERLDQELHMPLAEVSYGRDIEMRGDVTIGDDVSSFTLSTFGSAGGLGTGNGIGNGKAWMGRESTQITRVSVDIAKKTFPLRPWATELAYTILDIESAAKLGRPVDQQQHDALKLKHQMDIDEQVYFGDTTTGDTGMLNSALVTNVNNLPLGAQGSTNWAKKTADEILADFNFALTSVWTASAWSVIPSDILLPTTQFGYIATAKVSQAGDMSILKYIQDNNLLTTSGRGKVNIFPAKWANGIGVGGTIGAQGTVDRMMVYSKNKRYIRYPMTTLQRTPVQYDGMYHKATYYCRLGVVETVYPETVGYFDGL